MQNGVGVSVKFVGVESLGSRRFATGFRRHHSGCGDVSSFQAVEATSVACAQHGVTRGQRSKAWPGKGGWRTRSAIRS